MKKIKLLLLAVVLMFSCQEKKKVNFSVVCTTAMIQDIVQNIAKDKVEIQTLVGAGIDPHLYKPTQKDVKDLLAADMIFYNGLHLEAKLGEVLEKMKKQKPVIAVGTALAKEDIINDTNFQDAQDPHIWHSVKNWMKCTQLVFLSLVKHDKKSKEFYTKNLEVYMDKLQKMHQYILEQIQTIPQKQRIMITSHDAFSYYGKTYGIKTKGLQGISTLSEFGLKDVVKMIDFIIKNNIKSIFTEMSVSDRSLKAIIEGCAKKGYTVKIANSLYADSMGVEGTKEATYIGMLKYNTQQIVKALK